MSFRSFSKSFCYNQKMATTCLPSCFLSSVIKTEWTSLHFFATYCEENIQNWKNSILLFIKKIKQKHKRDSLNCCNNVFKKIQNFWTSFEKLTKINPVFWNTLNESSGSDQKLKRFFRDYTAQNAKKLGKQEGPGSSWCSSETNPKWWGSGCNWGWEWLKQCSFLFIEKSMVDNPHNHATPAYHMRAWAIMQFHPADRECPNYRVPPHLSQNGTKLATTHLSSSHDFDQNLWQLAWKKLTALHMKV